VSRAGAAKRRQENEIEFSRIVAFSDGVFAIAITLLVLNLGVPEHVRHDDLWPVLRDQGQDLFAYALSFAVIGRFWVVHHRFFGDVTGFDGRLIALNLFYLSWIVLLPFSSQVLGDHGGDEAAVILYSINLVGAILSGTLMFADARRAGLSRTSPEEARAGQRSALVVAAVFPRLDPRRPPRSPPRSLLLAGPLRRADDRTPLPEAAFVAIRVLRGTRSTGPGWRS
jgi:uncharacterized membrane protein